MRWPLRYQIMLPMAAIMLLAVFVVGGLGAALGVHWARARIESQIAEVRQLVQESNFPLSDSVLRQMRALSGAELVLAGAAHEVIATSGPTAAALRPLLEPPSAASPSSVPGDFVRVGDRGYFHSVMDLPASHGRREQATLHILYPEADYRRAWQSALYPSLGFVVLSLPVVVLLALFTAARISRRISRLQDQVERIARGDFRQLALSQRDDEIRALGDAVNRMALMLARYEEEVRQTERMRTLAQLGSGMAHQLRNAATGCNMALDLHAEECSLGESCESLSVARRQLQLMEEYLQRFLKLGRPQPTTAPSTVNLASLVADVLPLVQPAARHAGVDIAWHSNCENAPLRGDAQQLNQLVINLLLNAIEAAAAGKARDHLPAQVSLELTLFEPDRLVLMVSDSGPGPAGHVQNRLFEAFVTEKPDGVGLGLSVARQIVEAHGGSIRWSRSERITSFVVDLPCEPVEISCA
jgi:signal transduction histidine kinase